MSHFTTLTTFKDGIDAFTGVRAAVMRGQTTTVQFTADKMAIFPVLCLDHPDVDHKGPMIGYLVVQ
jgi:hypothetical protein